MQRGNRISIGLPVNRTKLQTFCLYRHYTVSVMNCSVGIDLQHFKPSMHTGLNYSICKDCVQFCTKQCWDD